MDSRLEKKLKSLRSRIRKLDSAVVAFSGGPDSTLLTRLCREELGTRAVAVTSCQADYPCAELAVAKRIAKIIGIKHIVIDLSDKSPGLTGVYSNIKSVAMRMKLKNAIDSSHLDDREDRKLAAKQARIRSPLLESNLSKAEIGLLAKELGLSSFHRKRKFRPAEKLPKPAKHGKKSRIIAKKAISKRKL